MCDTNHHHHPGYDVLHDETEKCCMCCLTTPKSREIEYAKILKKRGTLNDVLYDQLIQEIENYFSLSEEQRKNTLFYSKILRFASMIDICAGSGTLRYSI